MRITRFINGKKIVVPLESKPLIENDIVASTIEKVNLRVNSNFDKTGERFK